MTSVGATADSATADWRVIVRAGVQLGAVTAVGVAVFALLSRATEGATETVIQSIVVLAGGAVVAFGPSMLLRPRNIDGIAWAAMIGLLGALTFTVIDTVLLRPLNLYHWTWDAIGGGSGFWYVPVWWMGAAFLAWLGAWTVTASSRVVERAVPALAAQTAALGLVLGGILMAADVLPFHGAGFALAFTAGLVIRLLLAGVMHRG